ncbi:MAG: thioredoxin domain-containing protein [Legionellales bacterium]|nr:thioredoxin domain-containing protein [Legionellales bacterium]
MKSILYKLLLSILCLFNLQIGFAAPITGNPTGNVTLIEYYDYECPHCRRMEPVIDKLQEQYSNLKIMHRVTPLLTPASRPVASFALASESQGKWQAVHQQLMTSFAAPTLRDAEIIAKNLSLNIPKILGTMQSKKVQQQIAKNIQLANTHAVDGGIYLPILVFGQSNGEGQPIVLTGEQPYALLSAIVQQLGHDAHVQLVKNKKRSSDNKKIVSTLS